MSVAKEAKLKEWSCNIFSQTLNTSTYTSSQRPEQQLFSRKRRSEASDSSFNGGVSEALHRSSSRNDRNDRSFDSNFYKKKDQGIFLYESANAKGSLTPSGSDYCSTKKYKEGLSMQNILQPYLALDVIKIDNQGYVPNITNANTTMNKDRSAPRLNQQQQQKQNLNNSFNCLEKYGGSGPQTTKHNKINLNTHLKLEMDSIKEEDNSVFKGLGKNHDKGLKQMNSKNQYCNSFSIFKTMQYFLKYDKYKYIEKSLCFTIVRSNEWKYSKYKYMRIPKYSKYKQVICQSEFKHEIISASPERKIKSSFNYISQCISLHGRWIQLGSDYQKQQSKQSVHSLFHKNNDIPKFNSIYIQKKNSHNNHEVMNKTQQYYDKIKSDDYILELPDIDSEPPSLSKFKQHQQQYTKYKQLNEFKTIDSQVRQDQYQRQFEYGSPKKLRNSNSKKQQSLDEPSQRFQIIEDISPQKKHRSLNPNQILE